MLTRSKRSKLALQLQENWTSLPVDVVSIIMSALTFAQLAKCSEINKQMQYAVNFIMKNIHCIDDKITVKSIDYVVKKCHSVQSLPYICGADNYDVYSMRKLLGRWPTQLHLNWDMTNTSVISTFLKTLSMQSFTTIKHMSLKITQDRLFRMTTLNLHYMELTTLKIDAEGCNLEVILSGLNCRCWDVEDLYLRGDVNDLGTLMIYTPAISSSFTIINTNDSFNAISSGTENGLRFIMNSSISVELCNIIKFCCDPPNLCSIVDLFVYAVDTCWFYPRNTTWKIDRLQVDMIEALLKNAATVHCGAFQCEMPEVNALAENYPGKLNITSVL